MALVMANSKNIGPFICLLIIVVDVIAGMLGIEAEISQNKVKQLRVWIFECRDPSYQAFKLGFAAALLLAFAHVLANMLGGCICMWSTEELDKSSSNKQLAVSSLVLSWIILVIAFSMLIAGALSNSHSRANCGVSHHRFLSIGGVLCFLHGLFAVAYYISATATLAEENKLHQAAPVTA
ncbi:protein DESIGUAL 2 [Apium graveolens]|uniref:protein DESIGUAL 2 n=1 Tax=Apium graveolens TaxID=4045 RepID=UPI003D78DD97